MPTRLNDHLIRKEVKEKLGFIRVHLLGRQSLTDDVSGDANPGKTSQKELANLLGISQPEASRLLLGECTPHRKTLGKIYEVYFKARCINWGAEYFHPICALASRDELHSYSESLPATMMALLHATLDKEPLLPVPLPRRADALRVDLHMRAAKLPPEIEAYSFGNDPVHPDIFVVLVNSRFGIEEQHDKAWDEVQAHVVKRPGMKRNVVPISRPILYHYVQGKQFND